MTAIDLAAFEAAPLNNDPFDHVVVPNFIRAEALVGIHADFPAIDRPGSIPVGIYPHGGRFGALLDELRGPELERAFERKFDVDLARRPTMFTVRGMCRATDGKIHPDSRDKIITVLIYLNPPWEAGGGRLRLLRSPDNLEDYAAEVPPNEGTLLAFRRSDTSWHGHEPYEGQRRAIQLNWVTSPFYVWREQLRHRVSARLKGRHQAA